MNGDNKNRAILFRGKATNGDGWVEGSYMEHYFSSRHGRVSAIFWNEDSCCQTYRTPVRPETVGQYTGLKDRNGVKIFEGDILRFMAYGAIYTGKVQFLNGAFWIKCRFNDRIGAIVYGYKPEIIGNIHDNPELLEV